MTEQVDALALRKLADLIIPGDADRWPAASTAVEDIQTTIAELTAEDAAWALDLAREVALLPLSERISMLSAREAAERELFGCMVGAVYRAYYTTAAVMAVVEAIANAGPREVSPSFDTNLVAQVVATRAGQRRL